MMNDTKPTDTLELPAYMVTAESSAESKAARKGPQTKYIAAAVAAVLIVGLIITGIVLGVYYNAEAQKEIVKFSFQFKGSQNNDVTQNVISDPNDNVVMYHMSQPGKDAYVVNDFNKGLQIIKIVVDNADTNCFVTILNVTDALDPSKIKDSSSMLGTGDRKGASLPYQIQHTPVADRSFLTKKAADMCSGVSLYWANKNCLSSDNVVPANTTTGISKRSIYHMQPLYRMGGLGDCCAAYWACYVQMTEYYDGNGHYHCSTYYQTTWCCYANNYYYPPIQYPQCTNLYYAYWHTPGEIC